MADIVSAAEALEASGLGEWMRTSAVAYPVVNLLHLLGLVLLIGGIGIADLRLIGFGAMLPLGPVLRFLTPFAIAGLILLLGSGFLLFAADAAPLVGSAMFGWKMALLAVAGLNALGFQLLWRNKIDDWRESPPPVARTMAAASIGLWFSVATLGRLLAYS